MSRFVVNSAAGLRFSFLWWIFAVSACLLFLTPDYSIGSTFTVQDIIDGIAARRSKVSDVEFQYLITQQNHDAYYTERLKQLSASGVDLSGTELNAPPRLSSNAYHLLASGNKRAFEIFDVNEDERVLNVKAVYDGQNLKLLNVREQNGVIQRLLPQEVIPFPTLPKLQTS